MILQKNKKNFLNSSFLTILVIRTTHVYTLSTLAAHLITTNKYNFNFRQRLRLRGLFYIS